MKDILKHKIEMIQDTVDQDNVEKLTDFTRCLDDLEKREAEAAALKKGQNTIWKAKSQQDSFAN